MFSKRAFTLSTAVVLLATGSSQAANPAATPAVAPSLSALIKAGKAPVIPHPAIVAKPAFSSTDITPPVLNSIKVTGAPNMTKSNPYITVTLDISDDESGFASGVIYVSSPDGSQQFAQDLYEGSAPLHVKHTEQMGYPRGGSYSENDAAGYFMHWSQPGTWTVTEVLLTDVAGNSVAYMGDQLAALGNNTFKVSNAKYDGIPPLITGGSILTPTVSLSAGNDAGIPLVQTQVSMTDTGEEAAAGVDYVALYYCLPPVTVDTDGNYECNDYLTTYTSLGVPSSGVHTTVTTSGVAYSWNDTDNSNPKLATPGVYQLAYVVFATLDGISNNSWSSAVVGGTTDFSRWFPGGTTVTITP